MRNFRVKPDNFTVSTLIKGISPSKEYWHQLPPDRNIYFSASCLKDKNACLAVRLFNNMLANPDEFNVAADEILFNCMIDMCVRFKDLNMTIHVFN